CDVVVEQSGGAYPELREKQDYIKKIISMEEERFGQTIDAGLNILSGYIEETLKAGEKILSGEKAFKLYDTFGFPMDLTAEIAAEKGLSTDEEAFGALMKEQKERARAARADLSSWEGTAKTFMAELPKTEFVGYTENGTFATVLALVTDEGRANTVTEGDVRVILDKTVCYGESGGQVGDTGTVRKENGDTMTVNDTKKEDGVYVHFCTLEKGSISEGDKVFVEYAEDRRKKIIRNHSAAHLLQAALRKVLGSHVEQAGSYVDENEVRFDFSHFAAMTPEEIKLTENCVNGFILDGADVETVETDVETAKKSGAMALFGEKYGKVVRMVKMGDYSTELCGGTHVDNTAKVGLFKIVSEASVASGVRRIVGVTGTNVLKYLEEKENLIAETAKTLKANNPADIANRAAQTVGELAAQKKTIDSLNSKLASGRLDEILANAESVGGVKLAAADLGATSPDAARALGDKLRDKDGGIVAVLAIHEGERLNFLAVCGADAVKAGAHAGKLVGAVAQLCGGKGGGRPDSAMAGGKDITKIAEALAAAKEILSGMMK
ncbi:MAG: alanine--tRNA ligase, partial [Clostridia bacterium]|nr:alanine--tRNA ligase [Clostridia bacterium]